ncbi:MAG: hypothetical protein RR338_03285 [Clostridia bacterium]
MSSEDKIFTIKKDLRHLRKITHSIEVSLEVKIRHEKRLLLLESLTPNKEILDDIKKIKEVLATLNIEKYINKATELEARYISAINQLEPLDKMIILDGYINGKAYWKIGRDIGYTESGIQSRINKIIERLAALI